MKIAILSVGDYKHITLISKYTQLFEDNDISYNIICTDRYNSGINREKVLSYSIPTNINKLKKIYYFLKFHNWAKKIIGNNYDFIVVWNENTALLFFDLLLKKYKKKYCVNIRDVDFLNQRLLNIIRSKVIKNSRFSTYCSTAKLDFPKNYNYVLMRSINLDILKSVPKKENIREKNKPIRIVYIGKVRFNDANEEIIKSFGNDKRYELWFIGSGSEELKKFESRYNNLHLVGSYEPEETANYLANADVINSYFGTKVLGYERMSSIRFSYAPYIHIPVIVGVNTNMENEGNKYGFAYGYGNCSIDEEADNFYEWYSKIDFDKFVSGCEKYCLDAKKTDERFVKLVEEIIKENDEK